MRARARRGARAVLAGARRRHRLNGSAATACRCRRGCTRPPGGARAGEARRCACMHAALCVGAAPALHACMARAYGAHLARRRHAPEVGIPLRGGALLASHAAVEAHPIAHHPRPHAVGAALGADGAVVPAGGRRDRRGRRSRRRRLLRIGGASARRACRVAGPSSGTVMGRDDVWQKRMGNGSSMAARQGAGAWPQNAHHSPTHPSSSPKPVLGQHSPHLLLVGQEGGAEAVDRGRRDAACDDGLPGRGRGGRSGGVITGRERWRHMQQQAADGSACTQRDGSGAHGSAERPSPPACLDPPPRPPLGGTGVALHARTRAGRQAGAHVARPQDLLFYLLLGQGPQVQVVDRVYRYLVAHAVQPRRLVALKVAGAGAGAGKPA